MKSSLPLAQAEWAKSIAPAQRIAHQRITANLGDSGMGDLYRATDSNRELVKRETLFSKLGAAPRRLNLENARAIGQRDGRGGQQPCCTQTEK